MLLDVVTAELFLTLAKRRLSDACNTETFFYCFEECMSNLHAAEDRLSKAIEHLQKDRE